MQARARRSFKCSGLLFKGSCPCLLITEGALRDRVPNTDISVRQQESCPAWTSNMGHKEKFLY